MRTDTRTHATRDALSAEPWRCDPGACVSPSSAPGPSGVYTAQSLVQQGLPRCSVDVLDRLPCPYGLVRYGVAPDHEKIKSLQNNLRDGPGARAGALPRRRRGRPRRAAARAAAGAVPRGRVLRGRRDRPASRGSPARSCRAAGRRRSSCPGTARIRTPPPTASCSARASAVVIGVGNVAVDVDPDAGPRRGRAAARPTCRRRRSTALAASRVRDDPHGGPARPLAGPLHHQGAARAGLAAGHRSGRGRRRSWRWTRRTPTRRALPAAAAPQRGGAARLGGDAPPRGPARAGSGCASSCARSNCSPTAGRGGRGALRADRAGRARRGDGHGPVRGHRGAAGAALGGLPRRAAGRAAVRRRRAARCRISAGRVLRDGVPSRRASTWRAGSSAARPGVIGTNRPCAKETATSLLDGRRRRSYGRSCPRTRSTRCGRRVPSRSSGRAGWRSSGRRRSWAPSLGRGVVKLPDWQSLMNAVHGNAS